ncbi:MAG: radical SAM protein [Candidatus Aminicenantes bacterium]|jgi:radical SAM superfamily enzyme YgiQ (UPF0313 family)
MEINRFKQMEKSNIQVRGTNNEKILLVLLPFWITLIPPMGISCLKSYLQKHGFIVKTVDANIRSEFREIYDNYFQTLESYIHADSRGNFRNIAGSVLHQHMMAYFHYQSRKEYLELVKLLVAKTFFCHIDENQVFQLEKMITDFYHRLERYLINLLEQEKPSVLGLSVYRDTAPASLFAFRLAKERYPQIRTVMGGGIFTGDLDPGSPNYRYFLEKTPYIDKIIIGEGERLFLEYLQGKLPESQRVYTLEDINNEMLDLDRVAVPDFSDFQLEYYPNLAAYTSRSCPYNCSFCSEKVMWGKYRKKKPQKVVQELTALVERYRTQLFLMSDSLLNPVVNDLARTLLKTKVSIYWDGYFRVDKAACNPDNTMLWRQGGFYRARLGLESGSPHILQAMGKKIMPGMMKEVLSSLAYAGIKTTTYWVIGYPGETEADFQQTLDFIEELKDDIYEADCNPFSYFLTGQVNSTAWAKEDRSEPLYPEMAKDMLLLQTYILKGEPSREETFQRIRRFVEHCRNLRIPNPYSLQEVYEADERWKQLHKNAVPSIVEFHREKEREGALITENKSVKQIFLAKNIKADEGEWGF